MPFSVSSGVSSFWNSVLHALWCFFLARNLLNSVAGCSSMRFCALIEFRLRVSCSAVSTATQKLVAVLVAVGFEISCGSVQLAATPKLVTG